MASLHDVIESTKNGGKKVVIGIVILTILIVLVRFGLSFYGMLFPPPPESYEVEFGKLPQIEFPEPTSNEPLTYTLDTIDNSYPYFSDRVYVYSIENRELELRDLENAKGKVASVGFTGQEQNEFGNLFSWEQAGTLPKALQMDIVTEDFILRSNYFFSQNVLSRRNLPTQDNAIEVAQKFLGSMDMFPTDEIDPEQTRTKLLTIKLNTLVDAASPLAAHVIRVDFYQNYIDGYPSVDGIQAIPVFYQNPPNSSINLLIGSGDEGPEVLEVNYNYQQISDEAYTYPLKSTEEAWEELANGQAHIAARFGTESDILIKEILLGYYIGNEPQEYLMPIYIFKGEDDAFFAYVSAVAENCIEGSDLPCDGSVTE